MSATPFLDFRLLVDGRTELERRVDVRDVEEAELDLIGDLAAAMAEAAELAGRTWVHEVVDPDGACATLRFSNDPSRCTFPVAATPSALREISRRLWPLPEDAST